MFNLSNNDIIIRRANNGWVLVLPIKEEFFNPANLVSELKSELNKDEVLKNIQSLNEKETDIKSIMQNENIYIFQSFNDLIGFLKLNVE